MKNIEEINNASVKKILTSKKIPEFFAGDTIKVGVRIVEGKRERIQYFEGVCIAKKMLDKNINIICGHFEGVDQRLLETRNIEEVSVGDFVLSGGEIGALVIIDTIVRLIPGVLGNPNSLAEETFERNLLEYPQYTKPQKWEKKEVPDVLLTGDHAKIKDWRLAQSGDITRRRRPDLWKKYKKNK